MTEPEGTQPKVDLEATVTEPPVVTEPVATEEPVTAEEVSDAELRAWAKDNGIEGVPASGKLSASWREQITTAMVAVLSPKDEASVDNTSTELSISMTTDSTDQENPDSTDEESSPVEKTPVVVAPVAPEFESGEYRSVFRAPNTFVTSQTYTS